MTTVRKINVSQVEGDNANNTSTDEIRPYGELAVYIGDNDKLEMLMADGVRTNLRNKVLSKGTFYGGDADSGDGEGYDTIKLVPDEELRRNGSDQYLIIDPTGGEPNHIHIRAGGTIDQSSTDLFLGGEKNNVRVSDINDRVTITTDAGEGTRTWTFGDNGTTTFPTNISIDYSGGNVQFPRIIADSGKAFSVQGQGSTGSAALAWTTDPDAAGQYAAVAVTRAGGGNLATVVLQAQSDSGDVGTVKLWRFDEAGNLTLPAGGVIEDSASYIKLTPAGGTTATQALLIYPTAADGDHIHLAAPFGSTTELYLGNDAHYVKLVNGGNIEVRTLDGLGANPTWTFGNTGTFTFPDATVQTTAFTGTGAITFTGNEIEGNTFGGTGTIITKTVDNTGGNYSTGSGSIGFLNFGADGTIQNVKAGWTVTFASGVTRTVSQDAFQPLGTYWNISFDSGYIWSAGDVMPVTFSSPDYAAGTDPQVTLTAGTESWTFDNNGSLEFPDATVQTTAWTGNVSSLVSGVHSVTLDETRGQLYLPRELHFLGDGSYPGTITWDPTELDLGLAIRAALNKSLFIEADGGSKRWKFENNGNLTLPANGDIVNSTGVSQTAQRVEGSWTVTAGTNTYSFTVPMDGTYVMWVKGNIPNGIITWNATVSVSNTNVPAIGQQYAWNYTGGGSPILLTAMPDQIKGAVGTISTDATYAGTTSNRFDFGISNTSGASQTVYYGYTKI